MVSVARVTLPLLAFVLGACSASTSLVDAVPVPAATPPLAGTPSPTVVIVDSGPPAKDWKNDVVGTACQRNAWDKVPTNEDAVQALLTTAAQRGFNSVHSVRVGADVRSLAMNCWAAISATGIAFNDPSRPVPIPARPRLPPVDPLRARMQQG